MTRPSEPTEAQRELARAIVRDGPGPGKSSDLDGAIAQALANERLVGVHDFACCLRVALAPLRLCSRPPVGADLDAVLGVLRRVVALLPPEE